jgi:FkbM family methyltransferase
MSIIKTIFKHLITKNKIIVKLNNSKNAKSITDGKASINKIFIAKYLPDFPVIIDAGAHYGYDSMEFSILLKNARIYSFEPIPEVYKILQKKTRWYKNIKCMPYGLSDVSGNALMHVSSGGSDGSSSILQPKSHLNDHPEIKFEKTITVNTITLKDFFESQSLKKVDLLWLDLQGYELPVLKASDSILENVKAIHIEVSTKETYEGVATYKEIRKWLESKKFEVIVEAIPVGWDMGNVLFIKKNE